MIHHRSWTSFKTSAHKNPDGKPINLSRPSHSVISSCFSFKPSCTSHIHVKVWSCHLKKNAY